LISILWKLHKKYYKTSIKKMLNQMKINKFEEDLGKLKIREQKIKEEMNSLWLMQTPKRVYNLPSPPYVIIKDEIEIPSTHQALSDTVRGIRVGCP
jgi:hypothetical protein